MSGGLKYDADKADLSLLPKVFLEEVARVMMLGEKKYGRYNYTKGMEVSRLMAAAMRHITTYMDGESLDKESGRTHLAHAACCMLMAIHQEHLGTLVDNRLKVNAEPADNGIVNIFPPEGMSFARSKVMDDISETYAIDEKYGTIERVKV